MIRNEISDVDILNMVVGDLDKNINHLMEKLGTKIKIVDNSIEVSGENEDLTARVLETMAKFIEASKKEVSINEIDYIINLARDHREAEVLDLHAKQIAYTADGRSLYPKTLGQKLYIDSIMEKDIVFGTGPAGTGKTYLAVALAAHSLRNKQFERIILTRPAVEAGESLGFLPGDLQEKVDPYLRPIYDALFEILGAEKYTKYIEKGIIEIAPLAYMRGRTLDKSFIVLDEAQNTTPEQMKMFLTRLGYSSKMVITGDLTQTDLPRGKKSGLMHAINILKNTKGIGMVELQKVDIVRHPLVRRVIEAYENDDKKIRAIEDRIEKRKAKENEDKNASDK
ncbi:PhoH family protein [uncultured Ezakiella sp.]|uniref:PhoH family protein n=1 Tax=uncultured Ezakiella sp. TaxID=1637529 RepID=UPI0025F2B6EA|nr:PhoH family protein [uncultured Ezakiella sp.]